MELKKNIPFLNHRANLITRGTNHPLVKEVQNCPNVGPCLFAGRGNDELKIYINWWNSKNVTTTKPMSTKHGTKHPWVKGIHVCSNEEPALIFPRGEDIEIAKIHWRNLRNLKISFSRTTGPISTKLCTKHPWLKETKI